MKDMTAIRAFKLLPTNLLSRMFGQLTRVPLPHFLMDRVIPWYKKKYGVQDEYVTPPGGFRTVNQFFTRELVPGARPIDNKASVLVSPVDARVDQYGRTDAGNLIQAKGISYRVADLIPSAAASSYAAGSFITLYLSPGDYHRIHSPASGTITGFFTIPGALFTVQDYMVRGLPGLFVKNERLITYLETPHGMVAVCKIGAMNVGRISLSYGIPEGRQVVTNKTFRKRRERLLSPSERIPVTAGDELGRFNLGSTVIVITQEPVDFRHVSPGKKVRLGEALGSFMKKRT